MPAGFTLYTDGGSRGNPGPAAGAYVLSDASGAEIDAKGVFIGEATNNAAEYAGLAAGLRSALKHGAKNIEIVSDSELMVRQLKGEYRVKSDTLRPLYEQCMEMLAGFRSWSIRHVLREKNKCADELASRAISARRTVSRKATPPSQGSSGAPLRLAVLISGGGRTMLNLLDEIRAGRLNAEIKLVICSRTQIAGYEKALAAGLNTKVIRRMDHSDIDSFSQAVARELDTAGVDLVVQAGWLCLWRIPSQYEWKVMNIHPALLPSFGGKGMWGHHVHEAVLAAGCKVSGCTVHFCTNEYDKGAIIVQRCCPVLPGDDADSLAERVFKEECIAYPEAIRLFQQGMIKIRSGAAIIE
ncbi:MAG TPA: phosphoribosylglycinamide formyltransferase [Sedimentisphaerales bacterium]|nr:phosphoribosylglycinamide formyltransferase [Sedimentisphaerales bacterium]